MAKNLNIVKSTMRLAAGIILTASLSISATNATEKPTGPQTKPESQKPGNEVRRIWKKSASAQPYETFVDVNTKKKGDQAVVNLTLPDLAEGKLHFGVKSISVMGPQKKLITLAYKTPKVTFMVPEEQLSDITLKVTYIDIRSFKETTKDPNLRIDWNVRLITFKLKDALKTDSSETK